MSFQFEECAIRLPPAYQSKSRRCLKCQDLFASRSFGNRICPDCKKTSVWRSGATPWSC